jgi:hypothetical protein
MSVPPIGGLSAPANIEPNSISTTAQTHHKHGAHALKGSFAEVASNALGTVGQAHLAVSNAVHTASSMVHAALNNLKASS